MVESHLIPCSFNGLGTNELAVGKLGGSPNGLEPWVRVLSAVASGWYRHFRS